MEPIYRNYLTASVFRVITGSCTGPTVTHLPLLSLVFALAPYSFPFVWERLRLRVPESYLPCFLERHPLDINGPLSPCLAVPIAHHVFVCTRSRPEQATAGPAPRCLGFPRHPHLNMRPVPSLPSHHAPAGSAPAPPRRKAPEPPVVASASAGRSRSIRPSSDFSDFSNSTLKYGGSETRFGDFGLGSRGGGGSQCSGCCSGSGPRYHGQCHTSSTATTVPSREPVRSECRAERSVPLRWHRRRLLEDLRRGRRAESTLLWPGFRCSQVIIGIFPFLHAL